MIAYLGNDALKKDFLEQLSIHEQQDQFIQGTYGQLNGTFRGCGIGCSLHSLNILQGKPDLLDATDQHDRYRTELGLPTWLAHLEDRLFEALPLEHAKAWPRQFAAAIPVGATVPEVVRARILRWILADGTYGARHATQNPAVVAVVDRMIALFDREIGGDHPTPAEWDAAAWAARAAEAAEAARAARAAAWAAGAAEVRDGFYAALAAYVLTELAALLIAGEAA